MAAKIMILNGPNLNFLGIREPHIYGSTTLKEIETSCQKMAKYLGISISFHQSNLEGELVNLIQSAHGSCRRDHHEPRGLFVHLGRADRRAEDLRGPEDRGSYLQYPRQGRIAPAFDHLERLHRCDLRPRSLRLYRGNAGRRSQARKVAAHGAGGVERLCGPATRR